MMESDVRHPPIANTKIRYLIQKKKTAHTGKHVNQTSQSPSVNMML